MLEKYVLELNWNQHLREKDKIEHLSSYAHVIHTTEKQVISKDEKCTCKACKNTVFRRQKCKFVGFLFCCGVFVVGLLKLHNEDW